MKSIFIILLTTFTSAASFAGAPCTLSAEEHRESNMGYEVGYECTSVILVADRTTQLKFIDGAAGECQLLSQREENGQNILEMSMDSAKEDTWLGNGCRVKATYSNGASRIISVSAVEN